MPTYYVSRFVLTLCAGQLRLDMIFNANFILYVKVTLEDDNTKTKECPLPDQLSVNEDDIIAKLLANDESAYRQVVRAYHGMMLYVARSIIGDSIAEEVVQEAWLAVLKALPNFERRSSLKTWILRIVSNTAKSRLRRESRIVSLDALTDTDNAVIASSRFNDRGHWSNPPAVWHADTPESLLASNELKACIDNALNQLSPIQRSVITLRDMQGLDMDTICKILEVSESNARVLLHRARSHIREAIDENQREN